MLSTGKSARSGGNTESGDDCADWILSWSALTREKAQALIFHARKLLARCDLEWDRGGSESGEIRSIQHDASIFGPLEPFLNGR